MGLDLWFRDDVARILRASHEAMSVTAEAVANGEIGSERAEGYKQGWSAALNTVAMAFGLNEPPPGGWRLDVPPGEQ